MKKFLSKKNWTGIILAILLVGGLLLLGNRYLDMGQLHEGLRTVPAVLVFFLMALLPVLGFSIGLVYLAAGARFGGALGVFLVGLSMAIHLLLTYWIAHSFLRQKLERFLKKRNHHLPDIPRKDYAAVTLLGALVPGVPYAARNYLLAMTGVSLRLYIGICLPIYLIRATAGIYLGDFSEDLSLRRVSILAAILALKVAICYLLYRRVKKHMHATKA